jgi:hypothetical protein
MSSPKKSPPYGCCPPQQPGQQRQLKTGAAQSKGETRPSQPSRPTTVLTQRPQATPKLLQAKMLPARRPVVQTKCAPVAPPVYNPQPLPKVLQTKKAVGLQPRAGTLTHQPAAIPARHPGTKTILQPAKTIVQPKIVQTSPRAVPPKSPPVSRTVRANVVQRAVNNDKSSVGKRIVISNSSADDYKDRGHIVRESATRDKFVVKFDKGSGRLYRVHYKDMDYEKEWDSSSEKKVEKKKVESQSSISHSFITTSSMENSSHKWEKIDVEHQFQNCTDFAFEGHEKLVIQPDLKKLLEEAQKQGYEVTKDPSQATVVLYGQGKNYSHAIRKVKDAWYEVEYIGGPLRKYTGTGGPPTTHNKDVIVAMLKR